MVARTVASVALMMVLADPSLAVEGSSAAGPIGGTDIRAAQLPPPGFYAGGVMFYGDAYRAYDGSGRAIPGLDDLELHRIRAGSIMLFVPQQQVLGGSIGLLGFMSGGRECGRIFATTPSRCITGGGDPYVEASWSRFFGTTRQSQFAGALPIAEGLTLQLGFGVVIPSGQFNADVATRQGLVIGNNIWDFAPSAAVTYITRPLLADGTELSVKVYWNNYLTNPDTRYATGQLINIDFALTEKIGRLQLGLAGIYAFQVEDDRLAGIRIPSDGRRAQVLNLGGVIAYDIPELASAVKVKALSTHIQDNAPRSWGVAVSFIRKVW